MIIEKKTSPEYFQAILEGKRTFELRLADFECKAGDILVLKEWNPETKEYTGRQIEKKATFSEYSIISNQYSHHLRQTLKRAVECL
jgi:hypothetical protein